MGETAQPLLVAASFSLANRLWTNIDRLAFWLASPAFVIALAIWAAFILWIGPEELD